MNKTKTHSTNLLCRHRPFEKNVSSWLKPLNEFLKLLCLFFCVAYISTELKRKSSFSTS